MRVFRIIKITGLQFLNGMMLITNTVGHKIAPDRPIFQNKIKSAPIFEAKIVTGRNMKKKNKKLLKEIKER